SPVYATTDGGRTFRHLADVPVAIDGLALRGDLAVGTGFGQCEDDVIVSPDGGSSWQIEALPRGTFCGSPAVAPGPTILLACSSFLLVSRDRGRTWARERTPKVELAGLSASGKRIWAAGGGYDQNAWTLWHSDDGGLTWAESWISPPA